MSGRSLRRLPVLALARYIGIGNVSQSSTHMEGIDGGADVDRWLDGMERVVKEQAQEQERLSSS